MVSVPQCPHRTGGSPCQEDGLRALTAVGVGDIGDIGDVLAIDDTMFRRAGDERVPLSADMLRLRVQL